MFVRQAAVEPAIRGVGLFPIALRKRLVYGDVASVPGVAAMAPPAWSYFFDQVPPKTRASVSALLQRSGIPTHLMPDSPEGVGLVFFHEVKAVGIDWIRAVSHSAEVLAIGVGPAGLGPSDGWALLNAGAADVLLWPHLPDNAEQVVARLHRWASVSASMRSQRVAESLIG